MNININILLQKNIDKELLFVYNKFKIRINVRNREGCVL